MVVKAIIARMLMAKFLHLIGHGSIQHEFYDNRMECTNIDVLNTKVTH
jgi:hypothetical protein